MGNFKAIAEIGFESKGATEQEARRDAEHYLFKKIERNAGNKELSYEGVVRIEEIEDGS